MTPPTARRSRLAKPAAAIALTSALALFGSVAIPAAASAADTVPISAIQGTSSASPLVGTTVTTTGIVTAVYPTGGFDGFVIQTAGSGGNSDTASMTGSDAIFVFSRDGAAKVKIGDDVQVTGNVTEYFGLTEITATGANVVVNGTGTVPAPITADWPATDAEREKLESMLYLPSQDFTVTRNESTHQYGEVGLAAGASPMQQPTDVALPGSSEAAAVDADNKARLVTLDDGMSTNFLSAANNSKVPAYVSLTEPVRVGAAVTFEAPYVVDYRNNAFKLNPTTPLVGGAADQVTFENTRTEAAAEVGGDVSVASFNVLNYFTTLGTDAASCVAYVDRTGNGNNVKEGCTQRGAWDSEDLGRQQSKIVAAINGLDASVVGLMEIENSAFLGETPDEATATLVDALNAQSPGKWAYVPSAANLPPIDQQDVITNAIIYQPALVTPQGASVALADQSAAGGAFENAREPIAQSFVPATGGTVFTVVVNHFKSKGSVGPWPGDVDAGDGQGTSNESRVRQATALATWIATDPTASGSTDSLLIGDFNSYTQEDPMHVLYNAGFTNAESHFDVPSTSYVFQGLSGSLDHVLISGSLLARTTGATVWDINADESIALEYTRYNTVGAIYDAPNAYRSSDHDPVKVGLSSGKVDSTTTLTVSPATAQVGQSITLSATVASSLAPTGTVTFTVDGAAPVTVTLTGNVATATIVAPSAGTHTIVATYSGGGAVNGSASAPATLTTTAPKTSEVTAVALWPFSSKKAPATLLISGYVPNAYTFAGTVTIHDGTTLLGTKKVGLFGLTSYTVPKNLSVGKHTLTVTYTPKDPSVAPSTDTVVIFVVK